MKKTFRFTAVIISCIMLMGSFPVYANDEFIIERFDNYATHSTSSFFAAESADRMRIEECGAGNKGLGIKGDYAVLKKAVNLNGNNKFVFSFDVKPASDAQQSINAGTYYGTSESIPVYIKSNDIVTVDGKRLGAISPHNFTNIAIAFDYSVGLCNVYVNGSLTGKDVAIPLTKMPDGIMIKRTGTSDGGSTLHLDNICVYKGDMPKKSSKKSSFNSDYYDVVDINDWVGSYCYWDTDYINTTAARYQAVTTFPKNNIIETPRYDYKNKNRPTWLRLTKTGETNDDCYIDVDTYTRSWQVRQGEMEYRYYCLEGDFMTSGNVELIRLPLLRDSKTGPSNINAIAVNISGTDITLANGAVIPNVIQPNRWFRYAFVLDMASQTFSVYIDGKLIAENSPLSAPIKSFTMMRIALEYGYWAGSLTMDNVKFCGYEHPYVYGEDNTTTIFYDDTPVAEFLKDKVSFHAYARNLLVNGVKYELYDDLRYDEVNSQLYVKKSALEGKVDWDLSKYGDEINIKEYVNENGLYTYENGNGLFVITKDRALKFDETGEYKWFFLKPFNSNKVEHTTQLEALDDYVFFKRPSAKELSEKMQKRNEHPRLIADKSVFDECRELYKTDAKYKEHADRYIQTTDKLIDAEPRDYIFDDQYRMNGNFEYVLDRMTRFGLSYQLTGDKKYVDRAWKEFESLFTFPDINPSHTIDTGLMNKAVAIAYDWMYDGFSEEQRAKIQDFAINVCIKPVADGFYGMASAASDATSGFQALKTTTNYNAWVVGGLFQNVMAMMDCDEEYLFDIAEKCIRSLEYTVKGLAPDGAWIESPGYLNIILDYLMPYGLTAKICFGEDFNILEYQGVSEAGDWISSINGAIGLNIMGDSNNMDATSPYYMYINAYYGNKALAGLRKHHLINMGMAAQTPDILYYGKDVEVNEYENLPKSIMTKGMESCGVRESYVDREGLFFSAHGGANTGYHMHYDTGSFIFDLDGIRWAHDLGSDNYNIGLADTQIYRKRSEAHNVLTLNNSASKESMTQYGYAPITRFEDNESSAIVVYDMSDVYNDSEKYERGFYIGDNRRSLTVKDELTVNKQSDVYWFMNTMADVEINGNEARLSQGGKSLSVKVDCNIPGFEFGVMAAKPLAELPAGKTGQNPNSDYRKLYLKATVAEGDELQITAKLSAPNENAYKTAMNTGRISSWTLDTTEYPKLSSPKVTAKLYADGKLLDSSITTLPVNDDGSLPVITAEPDGIGAHIEITQAQKVSEKTVVTVYSEDKSLHTTYSISYNNFDLSLRKRYSILNIANYSVSSEAQAENAAKNMFDSNLATRWTSLSEGEYVVLDLGVPTSIKALAMAFWKSDTRGYNYEILVSDDGMDYTSVNKGTSELKSEGYQVFEFPEVTARYVKIIGTGNNENVNTNILELRALGAK